MNDLRLTNIFSVLPEQFLSGVIVNGTRWELWWSAPTDEYVLRVSMGRPQVSQVVARVHAEVPMSYLDHAIQTVSRSMLNLTHFFSATAKTSLVQLST